MITKNDPLLSVSYSGGETLQYCERKYCLKYLAKVQQDSDYVCPDYFSIGNAFHKVLELTNHEAIRFGEVNFDGIIKSYNLDPHIDGGRIKAMLMRYWAFHGSLPLKVVGCEKKFVGTYTNGVVDALMVESAGKEDLRRGLTGVEGAWWIVDLKTSGKKDALLPGRLRRDPQLSRYAAFRGAISENLDPKKFAGVRYRETFKPGQKEKEGETYAAWVERCLKGTGVREIVVPASQLDLNVAKEDMLETQQRAHALQVEFCEKKELVGKCNFKNCMAYNRPCEFYSYCYKKSYTEIMSETIINEFEDGKMKSSGEVLPIAKIDFAAKNPVADTNLADEFSGDDLVDEFSSNDLVDEFSSVEDEFC